MTSPILGEFLGTMMLVLLGNGVVAGVLLKRSKAEGGGWPVIAAGWAFAVMAGVFTAIACGSNDAHLNPAVTLVFAVRSGHFAPVAPYLAAQLPGGILGAALVWLHYLPRWKETPDASAKLGCFSTSPAIRSLIPNPAQRRVRLGQPRTISYSVKAKFGLVEPNAPVEQIAAVAVAVAQRDAEQPWRHQGAIHGDDGERHRHAVVGS